MKFVINGPLKVIFGVVSELRSELNCEYAALRFRTCTSAISFVGEQTTYRMIVSNPVLVTFSSIFSSIFGSVLNVAFSELASFFFEEAIYDFPTPFHFVSAGRINSWIIAASPSDIFVSVERIEERVSVGSSLYVLRGRYDLSFCTRHP